MRFVGVFLRENMPGTCVFFRLARSVNTALNRPQRLLADRHPQRKAKARDSSCSRTSGRIFEEAYVRTAGIERDASTYVQAVCLLDVIA